MAKNSFSFSCGLFWLLQITAVVWFLCSSPVSSHCLQHQKLLLLQLRHELSFTEIDFQHNYFSETYSKLPSWKPSTDCCLWEGIKCDQSGYVVSLDLSESYINGGINSSSSLFNLLKLQNLNLAFNELYHSPFPVGFGRLSDLTHLNLSSSGFVGSFPLEISLLNNLESLDLSSASVYSNMKPTKLTNLKLFKNLTRLRVLYLDGIDMSIYDKNWCQVLSQTFPNLRQLSLSGVNLRGALHPSLLQFKFLTHLHLSGNNFSQPVPKFLTRFSSLTSLNLAYSGFYGRFPREIFLIPTLQLLDVSFNYNITGDLPEFNPGSSLQVIRLSSTRFSGKLPNSIQNLVSLKELELIECGFNGSIPSSFETLAELRYLDFRRNNFSGQIPSLSFSKKITTIIFSHNHFTGVIPASYALKLDRLEILELGNNSLSGMVPLELLTRPSIKRLLLNQNQLAGQLKECYNMSSSSLQEIDLSENQLEGPLPKSIFNISSLSVLRLYSNQFIGTIALDMMRNVHQLTSLDLSDNGISVEVSSTNSTIFPSIENLGLGSCNISKFPEFLKNQTDLFHLDLSNNIIRGLIPNWLWDLGNHKLVCLNVSNNFLSGFERPGPNLSLSRLSILDLHSNSLQGSFLLLPPFITILDYSYNKFFSNLPYDLSSRLGFVVFISLSNNDFWGDIPISLCEASFLEVLDLSNNNFNGTIPSCLGSNEHLKVLKLRNNKLHGMLMQTYGKHCSLRTIDMNQNYLEGTLPTSLTRCRDLEVLDLGNNHLHGLLPFWLGNLPSLRVLILRANKFTGGLSYSKDAFQALQIIDVASNNLVGRIPSGLFKSWKKMINPMMNPQTSQVLSYKYVELCGLYYQDTVAVMNKGHIMRLEKVLTIFTCIDLSDNHFEGRIPESLRDLSSLYVLNLSNNHFTGHIHSLFVELKQLGSLDLSNNKLSGKIPQEFIKLTFLSFLNLSHNLFVGEIPQGGQLDTFPASSYEGNNELCGLPLSKCPDTLSNCPPNLVPDGRSSKSFLGLDKGDVWIGFGINVGAIAGCIAANNILRRRGRRFR